MLEQAGAFVAMAVSGADALEQVSAQSSKNSPFRLILLDLNMPDLDGFAVAEQLAQRPRDKTPIVMLSSSLRRTHQQRAREIGIGATLLKPVTAADLFETINRVLAPAEIDIPALAVTTTRSLPQVPLSILLAEDNPINQRLALRLLERRGHRVTLANDGVEAVAAFEQGTFDVILMDVQMPVLDGFGATTRIREIQARRGTHVPIIALTAHAMRGDRERCLAGGMDGYCSKPINAQELFAAIDAARSLEPTPAG